MMMLDAEAWAKYKGFDCAYVSSWNHVVGFYKKCGYIVDENEHYDADLPQLKKYF